MRLVFDEKAFQDLSWWVSHDHKTAKKILGLIEDVKRNPFTGKGRPEPLRYSLSGCWSRRIDKEHRLVYRIKGEEIRILACRYHY